jgi:hypothetical protein
MVNVGITEQTLTADEAERRVRVNLGMIDVGIEVLAGTPEIDAEELVAAIYRAMRIREP